MAMSGSILKVNLAALEVQKEVVNERLFVPVSRYTQRERPGI